MSQALAKLRRESPRGVLGVVADVLGVVVVIVSGWTLIRDGALPQKILAGAVCALALIFIGLAFQLQARLVRAQLEVARSVQVGRSLPKLAEATANLARAGFAVSESPTAFLAYTESACRVLGDMFGISTGHPCRVTLMSVYAPNTHDREVGTKGAGLGVMVNTCG